MAQSDIDLRAKSYHIADATLEWSPLNAAFEIVDREFGLVSLDPRRSKVVIYGAGHGKRFAPLDDPSWEVWNLNTIPAFDGGRRVRADRWFDIHQRVAQSPDDLRWIAACPRPIYVPADLADAGPTCVRFPLDRIRAEFGKVAASYFTCTFAYQIALALMEGFEEIGLYGVELSLGTRRERTVEWACVSWWVGFAAAKGVRIHVPKASRLGQHRYLYGFEYQPEIDEVNAYLRMTEDGDREEFQRLDLKRAGHKVDVSRESVGG